MLRVLLIVVAMVPVLLRSEAAAADFVPHHAKYKVSLTEATEDSKIRDVRGTAQLRFERACDGWLSASKFDLILKSGNTPDLEQEMLLTAWESTDGLSYEFRSVGVGLVYGGDIRETHQGTATKGSAEGAGEAIFEQPRRIRMDLPEGTLFPAANVRNLVEQAATGAETFSTPVFTGLSGRGPYEVSTIVSAERPAEKDNEEPLLRRPGWRAEQIYIPVGWQGTESRSEITFLDNGVAISMTIEYPEYTTLYELESVEEVRPPKCPAR